MQEYDRVAAVERDYQHVYLEPHLDDVALSCGGRARLSALQGERCLVVTVFAGKPPAAGSVTAFAAGQHARWGDAPDPIEARRAEERAALGVLGADWLPLPFLDAIYRGDQYLSDVDLFGPVKPGDAGLAAELRSALLSLAARVGPAQWYAPLGVGGHVDHKVVLEAALLGPRPLLLYEDFPYAWRDRAGVAARTAELGVMAVERIPLTETALNARIEAVRQYRSQLPVLFGGPSAMELALRAFATWRGGGRAAEQYWRAAETGAVEQSAVVDSMDDQAG